MLKPSTKCLAQEQLEQLEQQEQQPKTSTAVERVAGVAIVATALAVLALLAILVTASAHAQGQNPGHDNDKYSLVSPSGIAFSDFRGYEDWATASSARQDDILKVIVANPAMITAYKAGIPGNGQLFPGWLQDRETTMEAEEEHRGPICGECPRLFHPGFCHGKGQQEISKNRRLGIRGVQLRCRVRQIHARRQEPLGLRQRVPYRRKSERLHLPPLREALNQFIRVILNCWHRTRLAASLLRFRRVHWEEASGETALHAPQPRCPQSVAGARTVELAQLPSFIALWERMDQC